ncbi:MAG: hypothetical protein EKK40_00850 [Bradyrhizobiaceae bacterium]|nr:MAG: hypothetical protein EKK40_00850 [Bradyrhizobiaceae bacterium]
MKTNRLLPETDLARTALLRKDERRIQLRRIRDFVPTFSWSPFRACLPGIFQASKSLFDLRDVTWDDIEAAIKMQCKKHPNWIEGNTELSKLLFEHVTTKKLKSKEWSFGSLPVGYGAVVKFWPDFYTVEQDRPTVIYTDPRRAHGLTKSARQFVFSAMHHHIARADFADAQFKIALFPIDKENKTRDILLFEPNESDIVDVETLNSAIQETFQMWFEILEEREKETRKSATGTGGLFG